MRSTFKLLFYVNRQKIKATGKCPVMGRITVDGKVCQYSTGVEVEPHLWDADRGRGNILGQKADDLKELKAINKHLEKLEDLLLTTHKKYSDTIGYVTAELLKNVVTSKAQNKEMLLELLDEHNEKFEKRVGIDRERHTYMRYLTARKHIYNFLQYKFNTEDYPLRALEMQFIHDFNFYLSTILKLKLVSLNDYLIVLKKMTRLAIKQRTLKRDPFAGHKLEIPPKIHRHLSREQLEKVMQVDLPSYCLSHTRDLFVFSVFTGLGRAELATLTWNNIITGRDGSKWIIHNRQKTKAECNIKLLDIPLQILEKYKNEGKGNLVFYVPTTSSLCRALKKIEEESKLDCHLTFYMARHTFATETCLSNGVPIETISKMMGHSNIRTTQIYAEITNQKIRRDFTRLSEHTKELFNIPEDNMPVRVYKCGRYNGWKNEKNNE